MATCSRGRAISALVRHAKTTFEKSTEESNLVAPISPSPPELIREQVLTLCATLIINYDITVSTTVSVSFSAVVVSISLEP